MRFCSGAAPFKANVAAWRFRPTIYGVSRVAAQAAFHLARRAQHGAFRESSFFVWNPVSFCVCRAAGTPAARAAQAVAAQRPLKGRALGLCGARALPGACFWAACISVREF